MKKVNILDEIVVGPENTQKFLDLKKEEFSKVDYTQDKSTKIENTIMRQGQLVNGLNLINIGKLLVKAIQAKDDNNPEPLSHQKYYR